jgi:Subtilase family
MNILRIAAPCVVAGLLASASPVPAQQASSPDPTGPMTAALAAQLSQNASRPVIVIMQRQLTGADAASDQAPMMSELAQVQAGNIKPYRLVNAFAATVSDGMVARLKANPAVAQVVPDVAIGRKPHTRAAAASSATKAAPNAGASLTPNVIPGACGANGKVLLEPEALQVTNTDSDDPRAKTARSLGITGAGVKVAWLADGVDPNNINFIRPDGTSVFVDYQDFTGDGPGAPTFGEEAFLDSNAVAGQGLHVYNINGYTAQPDPAACNIRIEGVAPGAALVGLKFNSTFNLVSGNVSISTLLQAIDYAVFTDHVDVLNESLGVYSFPDVTALDAVKLFNDAAVQAGVTVTVASGDAGPTNTIAQPASDPNVIAVGASTTFRFYAQTNLAAARYFATTGWLNDNIAAFSSGGFSETGRTVDLVAPGDTAFASCDASTTYQACTNLLGALSDVREVNGTSMSAPLTAGAAALVIEAYRKFHHGASPAPALVKQILTSTASDLGLPATEQGAGLLNSYKAVLLAESINDSDGSPAAVGQSLLLSTSQLNAIGLPGSFHIWPVTVTNTGEAAQTVQVSGRTFGPAENVRTGSVMLQDGSSPQFVSDAGVPDNYAVFTFNVPGGADRLNASIAWPGNVAAVGLILIDPRGRFAARSSTAGVSNFGKVDVRQPVPGTWTGVVWSFIAADGGFSGSVLWQVSTQSFVPFGSVFPPLLFLPPGGSGTIVVAASTPATPGDAAGSIVLSPSGGGVDGILGVERNSIAVTLRSLIDIAHGGAFSGSLTGGVDDRPGSPVGQVNYFQFVVGPGDTSIMASLSLTNDAADNVGSYLIAPDGNALGFGQNQNDVTGINSLSSTAYTLNPVPGIWTLIVDVPPPVVGNEISQPFTGTIALNRVKVSASGVPNSSTTILPAGVPATVPVTITNTGAAPEAFFIDARLNTTTSLPLAQLDPVGSSGFPLPLTATSFIPIWLVPTQTSSIQAAATATLPIDFGYTPVSGDPVLFGPPTTADSAAGSYTPSGGTVTPGVWAGLPDELGPYSGPAPPGFVNMSLTATTKPFDPAVTSPTGDFWLFSINPAAAAASFSPVVINPGQTGVINVTITPSGAPGTIVSGNLYVDDLADNVPPFGQQTGDELAAIPYSYTVGPAPAAAATIAGAGLSSR